MNSSLASSRTSTSDSSCIHGFADGQCAACRTCPHGLVASRCSRCISADTIAARRRLPPATQAQGAAEEREGWEIFYAPAVSGWQIRRPDEAPLPDSYRSLFLARKAVDRFVDHPPEARPAKHRG